MKAVRIHSYGGREVLAVEDYPEPEIQPNDLLVRVHAVSVNPFDWKLRAGYLAGWLNYTLPLTLGWDVSGDVVATGAEVKNFAVGDEVFARADIQRDGGYAEYIAVSADMAALKPKSIDHVHTAAIPNAALAAWVALTEVGNLQPGQTVLIHAAAGGVGTFAVQIAKWIGARVIGTASGNNVEFLSQLGVDQVVDYTVTRFEDVVKDVDLVLDNVGGETQQRSWAVIKPGGMLVSVVEPPSEETAAAHGVRAGFATALAGSERLNRLADLVDQGYIRPVVSATLPLSEVRQAHAMSEGMHTRGKIVMEVSV